MLQQQIPGSLLVEGGKPLLEITVASVSENYDKLQKFVEWRKKANLRKIKLEARGLSHSIASLTLAKDERQFGLSNQIKLLKP